MIGRELGGRYEILTRIGGGGMALVYKAHDLLLSRNVAVKVLRQQYVHDEEFIRRFRREAQSAAALSHPNVVSIYDVGQEDEVHYIVMEYVEGYNLNEVIQERASLQADEAVRIAAQIADALDHAHQNHIIHRDIKPHNILIGRNGRVKVTDFGIARAVTSSTITQTGSVIGSVHYFSPEHAKGVSTGEKSDIYSLGIVLYQMVTGKLPFLGESPISVALKHLQEPLEDPRTINPLIPQSVENIIIKAMRKNPSERYRTAGEMLVDLETALSPDRINEPKRQFGANDFDETRVMPAIRPGRDLKQSSSHTAASDAAQEDTSFSTARQQAANEEEEDEPKRRKAWLKPLIIVLTTLALLGVVYGAFKLVSGSLDVADVTVPNVVGMTEADAKSALEEAGLLLEEPSIRAFKPDIPKDQVFAQSKSPDMRVKQGAPVKLSISDGPELKRLGDYKGQKVADAVAALQALGIPAESIAQTEVFDDSAEPGVVLSQNPAADSELDPATSKVTLTVSKGAETVKMPDLVGKSVEEARKLVLQAGLQMSDDNIVNEGSYKPEGEVLSQFPYDAGSQVSKGAQVSVTVSSGLPRDALEFTFDLLISPAQAGKASEIRIVFTDATGKDIQAHKRAIKETRSFPVKVVLAPNTEAFVSVYRDGQLVDTFSRTYDEVKNGSDMGPSTVPGLDPTPPPDTSIGPSPSNDPSAGNPGEGDETAWNDRNGRDRDRNDGDDRNGGGPNNDNG